MFRSGIAFAFAVAFVSSEAAANSADPTSELEVHRCYYTATKTASGTAYGIQVRVRNLATQVLSAGAHIPVWARLVYDTCTGKEEAGTCRSAPTQVDRPKLSGSIADLFGRLEDTVDEASSALHGKSLVRVVAGLGKPSDTRTASVHACELSSQPSNLGQLTACQNRSCGMQAPQWGASVYRGAQPTEDGYRYLRDALNVQTVIDLRYMPYDISHQDHTLGEINQDPGAPKVVFVSYRWNPLTVPEDAKVDELLATLKAASANKKPAYVHCTKGRDRTGMLLALHRVINEGWKPQAAYDEAVAYGFDQELEARLFDPMYKYFVARVKDHGPVVRRRKH